MEHPFSGSQVIDKPHKEIEEISVEVFQQQRSSNARVSLTNKPGTSSTATATTTTASDNPFQEDNLTPRGDDE